MSDDALDKHDDGLDAPERGLADLFRQVEAPASMRRWDSPGGAAPSPRWWVRLLLAPISVGGERRLRPLAAALVLPLLVLAVGGGMQLRAHFSGGTAGIPGNPPARSDAAMAFDAAHGQVVMFGGRSADGQPLGDTWTWDGSSWSQQHPAHSPSPRMNAAMAFDANHGEVVLFGGMPRGTVDETWTWDGSDWHATTAKAPPGDQMAMVYDAAHNQLVLAVMSVFPLLQPHGQDVPPKVPGSSAVIHVTPGGVQASMLPAPPGVARVVPQPVEIGPVQEGTNVQMWAWTGSAWKLLSSHGPSGFPSLSSLAWDNKAQRVVMLTTDPGAIGCGRMVTISGSAQGAAAGAAHAAAGATNRAAPAGWTGYSPLPASTPGVHILPPMPAPVPPHPDDCMMLQQRAVGSASSGVMCAGCPIVHQWSWDGSAWRESKLGDNVSLSGVRLSADPATGQLIAVDGKDTWTWDGSKWSAHFNPQGLQLRSSFALAADTAHNVVVLFGGRLGGQFGSDTWTWDGKSWTRRAGTGPAVPQPVEGGTTFKGSSAPTPVCPGISVDMVKGPVAGTVQVDLRLANPRLGCKPEPATLTLLDPYGMPLKIVGNGESLAGRSVFSLLWSNWCGRDAGSVVATQGNQTMQTGIDLFPTCANKSNPSLLALQPAPGSIAIP